MRIGRRRSSTKLISWRLVLLLYKLILWLGWSELILRGWPGTELIRRLLTELILPLRPGLLLLLLTELTLRRRANTKLI